MNPSPAIANIREEILEIPAALREALTKGRPEFDALIRRTRWGEGPVFMVGSGASAIVGRAGAYAFESTLARPVVARSAADFRAYSMAVLGPRSVLLAISHSGEPDEVLEAARDARRRGARVLALAASPASELAKVADGVFQVRSGEERGPGIKGTICRQAILIYLALLSALILKRPDPEVEALLAEFETLPDHAEWVLTRLHDAMRSFAAELKPAKPACLAGAGFYYAAALQWACLSKAMVITRPLVLDPNDFRQPSCILPGRDAAVVVLSGSRCRLKRDVHYFARACEEGGQRLLSITDSNDRELVSASSLAVLLPSLGEMAGSVLALIALVAAAYEAST